MMHEYPDLDGPLCQQLTARLTQLGYPTVQVSTELQSNPFPVHGQIWFTNLGGVETDEGQQDVSYQVRVIAKDRSLVKNLARKTRAIFDTNELMWYQIDNITPSMPIYETIVDIRTTAPQEAKLFPDQTTFFFTVTVNQTAN